QTTQRLREGEEAYSDALSLLEKLIAEFPQVSEYRSHLASTLFNLGFLLKNRQREYTLACFNQLPLTCLPLLCQQRHEITQAIGWFQRAYAQQSALLKSAAARPDYQKAFLTMCKVLAVTLVEQRDHAQAASLAKELPSAHGNSGEVPFEAARLTARCIAVAKADSNLDPGQRNETVRVYARQGLTLLRQALAEGYRNAERLKKDPVLEPLRLDAEFWELLNQLEAKR